MKRHVDPYADTKIAEILESGEWDTTNEWFVGTFVDLDKDDVRWPGISHAECTMTGMGEPKRPRPARGSFYEPPVCEFRPLYWRTKDYE